MSMGVAVTMLLVGLVLGFLLGTRATKLAQIKEALLMLSQAAWSFVRKITAEAEAAPASASAGGPGDKDQPEQDEDEEEDLGEIVERFLSSVDDKGLDDHPDLVMSPIIMYQVKRHKEQQAMQQRLTMLAAEGLTEDEIADRLASDTGGGSGGDSALKNPLALLISVGARVEAVRGGKDTDHMARIEARRKQKTVDVYLQKSRDVVVKRTEPKLRDKKGAHIKTALQIAKQAKSEDVLAKAVGPDFRVARAPGVGRAARSIYRSWYKTAPAMYFGNDTDDEDEQRRANGDEAGKRRGGGAIDTNALARLQAEYADGMQDDDDDGEEQAEDDNDVEDAV